MYRIIALLLKVIVLKVQNMILIHFYLFSVRANYTQFVPVDYDLNHPLSSLCFLSSSSSKTLIWNLLILEAGNECSAAGTLRLTRGQPHLNLRTSPSWRQIGITIPLPDG